MQSKAGRWGLLSSLRGGCPPPLSCPCVFSPASLPLSRARVLFTKHLSHELSPLISSIINVLATHHRAICDGLWLALRVAPSKFTAASSRDEGWGQTQGCGGGMGTQAALPLSCLSAKRGCRGQRATGSLLRLAAAARPAGQVCAARAGGSPRT